MPTLSELRQQYPGYASMRDEDIINDMAEANGVDSDVMASFLGWERPTFGKEAVRAVKRSAGSMISGVGEVGHDLGWENNPIARYGKEVEQANPSGINSFQDIADYPLAALGNATGNAATFLVPAKGLQLAGRAYGASRAAKAGLTGAEAAAAAARTAGYIDNPVTQAAVAGLPSLAGIGEDQRASGQGENLWAKYGGAGVVGAIENLGGIQRLAGINRATPGIQETVNSFGKTPWRTVGKTVGRSMLEEGAEELAQNPIEQWAGYKDPTTSQNLYETALGGAMGALGGLGFGAYHGGRSGMRHSSINQYRQQDLLRPDTPLDTLNDQAEWNRAFINRDQGTAAGDLYFNGQQGTIDNYIEGLVDPYRRQAFANEMAAIQARADQERIAARAPSNQYPAFDPRNAVIENMIERGPIREQQQWWENVPDSNGNPITISTVGEAYDYQHGMGKFAPQQAKVDGVLTPVQQGTPSAPQTQQVAPQAVATPPAQAGTQQATTPAAQGVKQTTPRGAASQAFETKLNTAISEGKLAQDDPIIADWHASKKLKADAVSFGQALDDKLAGPNVMPATAEQALQQKAANAVAEVKGGALNLTMKQIPVFDHVQKAFAENRVDDVIGADGKWKYTEIGKALGIERGQVMSRVDGMANKLAASQGISVEEMKAALRARTAEVRTTEMSEADKLGLSPKQQSSVFNEEDLFGNENGAEQNAEVINSVGGSQSEIGTSEAPTDLVLNRQDAPEVVAKKLQSSDRAMQEMLGELKGISEARRKEAMDTWNEYAESSSPQGVPFHEVPTNRQFTWALALNDFLDENADLPPKQFGEKLLDLYHEYSNDLGTINGPQQSNSIAESGAGAPQLGNTGAESQNPRLESPRQEAAIEQPAVPVVSKKKRRVAVADEAAGRSDSEGQAGEVKRSQGVTGSTTAERITSKLKPLFFSGTRFNNLVTVVDSADALPSNLQSAIDGDTQAFVQGGKVYMIAGNIAEGKELAVFLHEVGVHLGMAKLIGQENLTRLAMQIKRWAAKNDGSQESELAKKALARVKSAQKGGVDMEVGDIIEERVAYFIEEAVNAGINPQALAKSGSPIAQWFRTMWAAAKVALRKFGLDRIDSLSAQNLVDLAYGAARLELEGTWHGTAADFRNFNHSYMGSGEGAQAFGWGTYLAQRAGIAKGYWKDDVRRKGGVEGALMRVDSAVHEDEMLDWDKPLSEQSDSVKEALERVKQQLEDADVLEDYLYRKNADWEELTGKELYSLIERAHRDDAIPAHPDEYVRSMEDDEAASKYLDSIGIKGIKFLDSQSRHTPTHVANVVLDSVRMDKERAESMIAEANQKLKTAESEYAAKVASGTNSFFDDAMIKGDREQHADDVKYWESKKADADARLAAAEAKAKESESKLTRNLVVFNDKNIQRVSTQVGASRDRIKFSKAAQQTRDQFGKTGTQVMDDVRDVVSRGFKWFMSLHDLVSEYKAQLPSASSWYDSVRATIATRNKMEASAEAIAARAGKLKSEHLTQLNKFLAQSTLDQKWGYDATFTRSDGTKHVVKADPQMAQAFNRLPVEVQNLVKDIFAHGETMKDTKYTTMRELGIKDPILQAGALTGPYAPLKRFGDHIVVLKSKELVAAEKADDQKKVDELKKDGKHYVVSSFDTKGQAKAFERENAAKYESAVTFKGSEKLDLGHQMNTQTLQKLQASLKLEKIDKRAKEQFENLLKDMYLRAFDEHSARMSGLKRMNRAGFNEDMVRSFLSHARAEAGFLANMKHGAKTNEEYYKIEQEAKQDRYAGQDAFNAITQHYVANLEHKDTPIQDRFLALTTFQQLATNPAYHIQNLLQPVMVSVPRLAADFNNYAGAWTALRQGYAIVRKAVSGGLINDAKIDLSKVENQKLRDMLQAASDAGLLDVGMDEDLTKFESTQTGYGAVDKTSALMKKVVHKMRQTARRVEATNRISTAVAAFNMSYAKEANEAKATAYAISVLQDTQGDFSKTDAPLIIKKLPKFVVQYRKFQLMMAAHYVKAFRDAFRSEDPETRAVGRRTLAISLGHAFMASGVMGLPLMNLVGLAFAASGDDDEPKDLERSLREWIGDADTANFLLHSPLYFMGLDAKLSQDKIFSILPYADWNLTSKKGVTNMALGAMGPSWSNGAKMAEGLGNMAKGEYYDGLIGLLPSGLSNGVKAFEMANKGYTLKNGDVMVKPEDINEFGLLMDSMGLKSPGTRRMDWYKNQQWEVKQFYSDRTKEIEHQYADAAKSGDTEKLSELRQDWQDLQAGKDHLRYIFGDQHDELKRQPLSNLLKYPQTQAKRERKLQKSVPQEL